MYRPRPTADLSSFHGNSEQSCEILEPRTDSTSSDSDSNKSKKATTNSFVLSEKEQVVEGSCCTSSIVPLGFQAQSPQIVFVQCEMSPDKTASVDASTFTVSCLAHRHNASVDLWRA